MRMILDWKMPLEPFNSMVKEPAGLQDLEPGPSNVLLRQGLYFPPLRR